MSLKLRPSCLLRRLNLNESNLISGFPLILHAATDRRRDGDIALVPNEVVQGKNK